MRPTDFIQQQRQQNIRVHDPVKHFRVERVEGSHLAVRGVVHDDVDPAVAVRGKEFLGFGEDFLGGRLCGNAVCLDGVRFGGGVWAVMRERGLLAPVVEAFVRADGG